MPIETTIKLYKYEELTGKARDKARDKLANWNTSDGWYGFSVDDFTERLESYGFTNPEINFSGFWSQGDGLSFTSDRIDFDKLWEHLIVNKYIQRRKQFFIENLLVKLVRTNHRYCHERTVSTDMDFQYSVFSDEHPRVAKAINEIEEAIESLRMTLCDTYYKELESEYEYLTSEEAIQEMSAANDYLFDEHGEMR
jgi:hypothetical protein